MLITSLPFQQIDTFMRPMTTEGRQTVIMGKENFPLDISERETIHAIIKKHPELGKTSQKRRIGGKMESCICIYLSSFPSEVRTQIREGESQSQLHEKKSSCSSRDPLSGIFCWSCYDFRQ